MSSKQKQRKAAARARYESYLARRAEKARRHRRNQFIVAGVVIVAIVGAAALWTGGVFSDESPASADPAASSSPPPVQFPKAEQVLDKGVPASATLVTNQGDITFKMDTEGAPVNSNSVAFLAQQGYYDGTSCHRLTAADGLYVLQCGDPLGDGTGSPGYFTVDENLPKLGGDNYPVGTVAMAEGPEGVPGSQFFLVYKDTTLPADYVILGQITDGLDIVQKIAAGGVAGGGTDGAPATPITIESVTVDQG